MLTIAEAGALIDQHLGASPRARHSRHVGAIMRQFAVKFDAAIDLWQVVGLVHDLDDTVTAKDRCRHGLLTVEWIGARLPPDALDAIAAHDHRTGVLCETLLGDILKLADAASITVELVGREAITRLDKGDIIGALRAKTINRPYLCEMLERLAVKRGLGISEVLETAIAGLPS